MLQDKIKSLKPLYEIHSNARSKLDECLTNLHTVADIKIRRDLFKIYGVVKLKYTLLDNEFVECRRLAKSTPRYEKLNLEFEEVVSTFGQYLVIALLTQ